MIAEAPLLQLSTIFYMHYFMVATWAAQFIRLDLIIPIMPGYSYKL
jgi:hypothetical protein